MLQIVRNSLFPLKTQLLLEHSTANFACSIDVSEQVDAAHVFQEVRSNFLLLYFFTTAKHIKTESTKNRASALMAPFSLEMLHLTPSKFLYKLSVRAEETNQWWGAQLNKQPFPEANYNKRW